MLPGARWPGGGHRVRGRLNEAGAVHVFRVRTENGVRVAAGEGAAGRHFFVLMRALKIKRLALLRGKLPSMNNHSIFCLPASARIGYTDHVIIFTNTASKSSLP